MGNPAQSRTFGYSGVTYVTSGADSNFPASNIGEWDAPYWPFKSSGAPTALTTYVGVTWSGARDVNGLFLDNHNLSNIRIQTWNGSAWSTGTSYAAAFDQGSRKTKTFIANAWSGIQGIRVLPQTGFTLTDSIDTQMRVGSFVPVLSYTTWGSPITPGFGRIVQRAGIPNDDFGSGVAEPLVVGNYYSDIIINVSFGHASLLETALLELQAFTPSYFLFVQDVSVSPTEKAWIVRQPDQSRPALQYPHNQAGVQWQNVLLRECC